ncbi:MAG: hypothetical protein J6D01_04235 [Muribaculaceae bacterium]|nr:hypothetical protein [Muribaculaceae bacterium]
MDDRRYALAERNECAYTWVIRMMDAVDVGEKQKGDHDAFGWGEISVDDTSDADGQEPQASGQCSIQSCSRDYNYGGEGCHGQILV